MASGRDLASSADQLGPQGESDVTDEDRLPQAAQLPLRSFVLPAFPSEAKALKSLTLTSDIKPSEYTRILNQPISIPHSPSIATTCPQIESLTLELFALGYPSGFLPSLAENVCPNVKEVVLYSQLLDGTTEASRADARQFFQHLSLLRRLHILDCFVRPGFYQQIASCLQPGKPISPFEHETVSERVDEKHDPSSSPRPGLRVLEVNFTTQSHDPTFTTRLPADLPSLISASLISLSFNLSSPEVTDDPDDPSNIARRDISAVEPDLSTAQTGYDADRTDGITPLNKSLAPSLVEALTGERKPTELKLLNLSMYTLSFTDLTSILNAHSGILVLSVTVEVSSSEECKGQMSRLLKEQAKGVEKVEIIVSPTLAMDLALKKHESTALEDAFPDLADLRDISAAGAAVESLEVSVLKSEKGKKLSWEKKGGAWTGGLVAKQ